MIQFKGISVLDDTIIWGDFVEKHADKHTGRQVSLLGFGNMRLPVLKSNQAEIDYPAAKAMIDAAYAGGVNYFDTAYMYHGGKSEGFVGKALADYKRDSYLLATKLPMSMVQTMDDAKRIFAEQQQRLRTGFVDYYLLHAANAEQFDKMERLGLYQWLCDKKAAGEIGAMCFSFHDSADVLRKACDEHPWDMVQLQLNYLDWEHRQARLQYEILAERGIPCVVMEPVRGGTLADLGPQANAVLKQANPTASIASWALRWIAEKPGVLTVLSGMSTLQQVQDNLATFGNFQPLSQEEKDAVEQAREIFQKYTLIPCTACAYCMPCPAGVDIPAHMAMYNDFAFDSGAWGLHSRYKQMQEEKKASHCVACGACEKICPQHISIIDTLKDIVERANSI